ncbi:unnamed protein product [Arctia plantaginis]|uniref:J domain-containing protein n=1 Tax=Arctia plantaginis TaxID=874455 RepID=A0A8S0Z5P5_ARCPL|nr:unnamed protein product [Arctia plantaginis]CAB3227083.1 unnamed protein product [Arctia plantaginis]CAB3254535.1 unnamed protein product [Arctia plantaginis]
MKWPNEVFYLRHDDINHPFESKRANRRQQLVSQRHLDNNYNMKCHYKVLNLREDAHPSEIKRAYRRRRIALQRYLENNLEMAEEEKEEKKKLLQLVQNAYEVLSDPQERAWYDDNREDILLGEGYYACDLEAFDVYRYFSPSCYEGFGDDPRGFYGVYAEVFYNLALEESIYLDDTDVTNIPKFGNSTTEYEQVREFYAYWMEFSTNNSYWNRGPHKILPCERNYINYTKLNLKLKENYQIRYMAQMERNEVIRRLVSFVRRKDKRIIEHARSQKRKAKEERRF